MSQKKKKGESERGDAVLLAVKVEEEALNQGIQGMQHPFNFLSLFVVYVCFVFYF